MSDATEALRSRYRDILRRLDAAPETELEELKGEIIALFKTVDEALADLAGLKEDIRTLVDKYKQLRDARSGSQAPQFTGSAPALHQDHIGASTYIQKGWSLISLGDYDGAVKALEKAISLSSGDMQAYSLLGWAQMLNEAYDDALRNFQRVLDADPANSLARINVGFMCLKTRQFSEAIEHLSKAIRLNNDKKATLYAHFYLGLVYLERGMFEDAQTFLEKTLKLGPNLIEAHYELGHAYWLTEDADLARKAWADGFKQNKFNPWGKRCQEMLDVLERGGAPRR